MAAFVCNVLNNGALAQTQQSRDVPRAQAPARARSLWLPLVDVYASATIGLGLGVLLARGAQWPTYVNSAGATAVVSIDEQHKSRDLESGQNQTTLTRRYLIFGSDDPATVKDVGPQVGDKDVTYTALTCTSRKAKWYASGGRNGGGAGTAGGENNAVLVECVFTAQNDDANANDPEPTFAYEFGSESEHVETVVGFPGQVDYGLEPGDKDPGRLIGLTPDGVDGVDIGAPILDITEEHIFKEGDFTPAVRKKLRDTVQKVNSAPFREWDAGEVLLQGVSARKAGKYWAVTFSFRVRRNQPALEITVTRRDGSSAVEFVNKKGHQYLWVQKIRREFGAGDAKRVEIAAHSVHVATVYEEVDFADLGIGTNPLP